MKYNKKYIAGCFDSLKVNLPKNPESRIKQNTTTKNLLFAQFIQKEVGLNCKTLSEIKQGRNVKGYEFTFSARAFYKIIEYCGEYCYTKRGLIDEFYKRFKSGILKSAKYNSLEAALKLRGLTSLDQASRNFQYVDCKDDLDYLAGIIDSKFRFQCNSKAKNGRSLRWAGQNDLLESFLKSNDIEYRVQRDNDQFIGKIEFIIKLYYLVKDHLKNDLYSKFVDIGGVSREEFNKLKEFKLDSSIECKIGLNGEDSSKQAQERKIKKKEDARLSKLENEALKEARHENEKSLKQHDKIWTRYWVSHFSHEKYQYEKKIRAIQSKFETKVKRIANHYFRIIDTHKECTCCHKRLPKSEFRPIDKKSHIDGLYYMCYSCESKKGAKRYAQNTEKIKNTNKEYKQSLKTNDPEKYRLQERVYGIGQSNEATYRELAKQFDFTFKSGRRCKLKNFGAYIEQSWRLLPSSLKEDFPDILTFEEIMSLRAEQKIHFDHIWTHNFMCNQIKTGKYRNYNIWPNFYLNLRPLPATKNVERGHDSNKFVDYIPEEQRKKILSEIFIPPT